LDRYPGTREVSGYLILNMYIYNTYTTFKFQDTNKNINVTTGTPYSLHVH
jgi:hypothetical protein